MNYFIIALFALTSSVLAQERIDIEEHLNTYITGVSDILVLDEYIYILDGDKRRIHSFNSKNFSEHNTFELEYHITDSISKIKNAIYPYDGYTWRKMRFSDLIVERGLSHKHFSNIKYSIDRISTIDDKILLSTTINIYVEQIENPDELATLPITSYIILDKELNMESFGFLEGHREAFPVQVLTIDNEYIYSEVWNMSKSKVMNEELPFIGRYTKDGILKDIVFELESDLFKNEIGYMFPYKTFINNVDRENIGVIMYPFQKIYIENNTSYNFNLPIENKSTIDFSTVSMSNELKYTSDLYPNSFEEYKYRNQTHFIYSYNQKDKNVTLTKIKSGAIIDQNQVYKIDEKEDLLCLTLNNNLDKLFIVVYDKEDETYNLIWE